MRRGFNYRVSLLLFLSYITCFREVVSTAVVTLQSVEIFTTHEFIGSDPTVYFNCKGEEKIILPDLKKAHVLYAYKGQESWQPLTEFPSNKCKRCGFYAKHTIKSDDVFSEWEFCPSDFTRPDGKYIYSIDNEVNATFICEECVPHPHIADPDQASKSKDGGHGLHWVIVALISILASILVIFGLAAAYKFWQKKKRQKEQARFLKLFEDTDDIEDELGIGPLGGSV
ncbi:hypothetical protein DCAR_0520344 [Daucus carota subsp. sativus]|uniref:DUF7953 domain-containing protein n=1 Tax=Daucus carota subsp. sativus TaxID=79200 RepID=A0AAF1B2D9_DAUCS|nr:PREDICTED: uncharacterized protein LOC108220778 [Daucus carota subsp. sativus]WOH00966.1 hypothetical protein DCAR_0520344 [Daucus carota subsp. sativus]